MISKVGVRPESDMAQTLTLTQINSNSSPTLTLALALTLTLTLTLTKAATREGSLRRRRLLRAVQSFRNRAVLTG